MQKKPDIKIRKDGADITYENGDKVVFSYTKEKGDFSRYVHHTYLGYLDVEHSFLNAELYEDGKKTLNKKIEVETKYNKSISWSYEDEVKRSFSGGEFPILKIWKGYHEGRNEIHATYAIMR